MHTRKSINIYKFVVGGGGRRGGGAGAGPRRGGPRGGPPRGGGGRAAPRPGGGARGPPGPGRPPPQGKAAERGKFGEARKTGKKGGHAGGGGKTNKRGRRRTPPGARGSRGPYPAGKAGATSWAFLGTMLPASLRDHYYGRAYMYISGPGQAHNVYMNAGTTGFPISDFLEIGYNGGNFMISYQQNAPADGHPRSETTARQAVPPTGKWFCLEWEMINKPEDRIVLWVDGKLVANKAFTFNPVNARDPDPAGKLSTGLVPGGFIEYNVGYRAWSRAGGNTEDIDVYYDDVALGDKPIGQLAPVK